jgi:hypothetical protein
MKKLQQVMLIGAAIGAVLGAGASYLLMTAPSDEEDSDIHSEPITASELIALTGIAASLIRRLDNVRRKL